MEPNLDEEYYQKYLKYKEKYIQLKQLKNNYNDLEGGMWPFSLFSSKVKKSGTGTGTGTGSRTGSEIGTVNDNNTDGEYLVFFIDDEGDGKMTNENLDKYKNFIQYYYNDEKKQGIEFISIEQFINSPLYNEKAYIINKIGNKITCQIITNNKELGFYNKLQTIKNNLHLDKNVTDPIIDNLSNKCYTAYTNNVITNLNKSIQNIDNNEIKKSLEKIKSDFTKKSNSADEKQMFIKSYLDVKSEINKILNNDKYLIYKSFEYVKSNYKFNQDINNNSQKFFDELISKIKDNNKQRDGVIKLNMIIKIDKSKTHYKFAEYINKNTISYTTMYGKIDAALTKSRYVAVKNTNTYPPK
jgi:hypothetical protein